MKITHDDIEYDVDVKRAIELGICKPIGCKVVSGGVYHSHPPDQDLKSVLVLQTNWCTLRSVPLYQIYGDVPVRNRNGELLPFSNFLSPVEESKIAEFLQNNKYVLKKRIGNEIINLID